MAIAAPRFILVVEDERIVAEDICQTLAGLGYSATAEGSGEKALGIAAERQPDLALLDIRIRGSMTVIHQVACASRTQGPFPRTTRYRTDLAPRA